MQQVAGGHDDEGHVDGVLPHAALGEHDERERVSDEARHEHAQPAPLVEVSRCVTYRRDARSVRVVPARWRCCSVNQGGGSTRHHSVKEKRVLIIRVQHRQTLSDPLRKQNSTFRLQDEEHKAITQLVYFLT